MTDTVTLSRDVVFRLRTLLEELQASQSEIVDGRLEIESRSHSELKAAIDDVSTGLVLVSLDQALR